MAVHKAISSRGRVLFVALLAMGLAGTAHAFPSMPKIQMPGPEDLATRGILVGTFAGGNGKDVENLGHSFKMVIDGTGYFAYYVNNTFLVTLPPGAHHIQSISFSSSKDDYVMKQKEVRTVTFPLTIPVDIKLGMITTVGALYLFERGAGITDLDTQAASGPYRVLHIDNGPFMTKFLERQMPAIYAALTDKTLHPAAPYLDETRYRILHKVMALDRMRDVLNGQPRGQPKSRYAVFGALGLAGHVYTNEEGKPFAFRSFNFNTLDTFKKCVVRGDRYACLTETEWSTGWERTVFAGETISGKSERVELPTGSSPIDAHLFGTDGIALFDYDYQIHVRRGGQEPWQHFKQDGVKAGAFVVRYDFADTSTGFFTYYEGNAKALTFTNATDGATTAITLPAGFKGGKNVVLTDKHLLIGPEWNLFANSEVYARNLDTGEWRTSKLPMARCHWMGRDAQDKKRLYALCGLEPSKGFDSDDDGLTWRAE